MTEHDLYFAANLCQVEGEEIKVSKQPSGNYTVTYTKNGKQSSSYPLPVEKAHQVVNGILLASSVFIQLK